MLWSKILIIKIVKLTFVFSLHRRFVFKKVLRTVMESSTYVQKKEVEKVKKEKVDKKKKSDDEVLPQKLNEGLIEQMEFVGPKSKRSNFSSQDKVEEKYSQVGDVWTQTRGYELFLYHYVRRNHKAPICHPCEMNLGKLTMSM